MTTMMVVAMGGLGVLTVAWVAAISFRKASASLRHSIWLAALLALLMLPALEMADVNVQVPVPAALSVALPDWDFEKDSRPVGSVAVAKHDGPDAERTGVASSGGPGAGGGVASSSARRAGGGDGAAAGHVTSRHGRGAGEVAGVGVAVAKGGVVAAPAQGASNRAASVTGQGWTAGGVLFAGWLAGALLLIGTTTLSHVRARLMLAGDVEGPPDDALSRLHVARHEMGVGPRVRLVVSHHIRVPATWGFVRPVIALPPQYRTWSEETLDRVLLHELAHVARRDCEAYLVGDVARAVHWFNPLAWWAARNLRAESERACDDRVLDVIGRPSAYAADLVAIVRSVTSTDGVPRAALAMAQPGGLSERVRAILDPSRSRSRVGASAATTIGAVALSLVLAATVVTPTATAATPEVSPEADVAFAANVLPASASQERLCVFRRDGRRSTMSHSDDDEIRIRWETDDCRVEIEILGHVEFSADDRTVVALDPDARFEIEEDFGRDERRARLEGRAGGEIERRYWVDGNEVEWGAEADRWLASILPEIFRHTTINAEARVRRMVDEGGPDGVFAEVERIQSDHVSRRYLELLMESTELDEGEYRRVIQAAADIDSDHGSAELLMAVISRAGLQSSFQDPLLAASERLDSDHQRTRILRALLDSPLSGAQLDAVLRSARSIDSDHNLGELLSSIAAAGRMNDASRASFLETLRSIDSDHQQANVIHAFLDSGRLSDEELSRVLELTDNLESDHQRADVLQRVAREYPLRGDQVTAYLRSAAGMESDHQTASTARVITERSDFDGEQMMLVLRMAQNVESDHQQAEILNSVIRRRSLDDAEMSELLRVAATIDSSHQLGNVVRLVLEEQELAGTTLLELLGVVAGIDSSHQQMEALLGVARRYELSGAALDRYSAMARAMGSRDRERLMAALSR